MNLKREIMSSKKNKKEDKDPCWKNYEQKGTKKKDGKTVPNCIPKEKK